MSELRGRSLRVAVGVALLVVGLVEVYSLLLAVRTQRRLRDVTVSSVRIQVLAALPDLRADLAPGGFAAWQAAAQRAVGGGLASEVEVRDSEGQTLYSFPTISPVGPGPSREAGASPDGFVTVAAQTGPVARALTDVPFVDAGRALTLRLSTRVPDLEREMLEREYAFAAHLAAFAVLVLAAGLLVATPGRPREPGPSLAFDAYEKAMERLRERGQELSREHEAERGRMEAELHEKEAMARAGELTAGIVHEVRNGLGTILGYARMIERDDPAPAVTASAGSIREECETLEAVVRRFMQFVKQERLERGRFDLARLVSRVAARESRGRPGRDVTLDLPPECPFVGDEELLERAFENVVRNALEAAGPGGRAWVALRGASSEVVVTVEDDGPGLPAEARANPRPFFTTKPGGLGLGLPLARKIVGLHGGEIALDRRHPKGTTVRMRLPVENEPA